ncbi:MAG: diguanylate cyclase [Pararhizobium sp.]
MISYWQGLTANLALVALVILIWSYIEDRFEESRPVVRQSVIGLVAGAGVLAVMSLPVVLAPGLVFDLRVAIVIVATFYGGAWSGAIGALLAIAYRLEMGGVGVWAGLCGIVLAYAVAWSARALVADRDLQLPGMVLLGCAAATANVLGLLLLPHAILLATIERMALPASTLTLLGTVFAGLIIRQEFRRRALSRSNRVYRQLVEALPDCLNVKDRHGRFLAANSATARLMGAPNVDALIGRTDFDFYPAAMAEAFSKEEQAIWRGDAAYRLEQSVEQPDGSMKVLLTLKAPLCDVTGETIGLITHNSDVSEHKRLQDELAQAHHHLDIALANMADGLVMFDRAGRIIMCNQRYRDLFPKTGYLRVAGADMASIVRLSVSVGEEKMVNKDHLERVIADNCAFVRRTGTNLVALSGDRWLEARSRELADGNSLTVLSDVTERKRAEEALALANRELLDLATTDGLTGLANRRHFDEVLAREFASSARDHTWLGLLIADVDRFKDYNDIYGHLAGDDGLRRISAILEGAVRRPLDTPARFGGEEFAAILPDTDAAGVRHIAERFRQAVEEAALKHARSDTGCLTVSVGFVSVIAARTAVDPRTVLARADQALYAAKSGGRNCVCSADDDLAVFSASRQRTSGRAAS